MWPVGLARTCPLLPGLHEVCRRHPQAMIEMPAHAKSIVQSNESRVEVHLSHLESGTSACPPRALRASLIEVPYQHCFMAATESGSVMVSDSALGLLIRQLPCPARNESRIHTRLICVAVWALTCDTYTRRSLNRIGNMQHTRFPSCKVLAGIAPLFDRISPIVFMSSVGSIR